MNGGPERELGRLAGAIEEIGNRLERVEEKIDVHVEREERRLQKIEQQLSLGRFLLLFAKAIVLTIVFVLAFKFGDISNLWKAIGGK